MAAVLGGQESDRGVPFQGLIEEGLEGNHGVVPRREDEGRHSNGGDTRKCGGAGVVFGGVAKAELGGGDESIELPQAPGGEGAAQVVAERAHLRSPLQCGRELSHEVGVQDRVPVPLIHPVGGAIGLQGGANRDHAIDMVLGVGPELPRELEGHVAAEGEARQVAAGVVIPGLFEDRTEVLGQSSVVEGRRQGLGAPAPAGVESQHVEARDQGLLSRAPHVPRVGMAPEAVGEDQERCGSPPIVALHPTLDPGSRFGVEAHPLDGKARWHRAPGQECAPEGLSVGSLQEGVGDEGDRVHGEGLSGAFVGLDRRAGACQNRRGVPCSVTGSRAVRRIYASTLELSMEFTAPCPGNPTMRSTKAHESRGFRPCGLAVVLASLGLLLGAPSKAPSRIPAWPTTPAPPHGSSGHLDLVDAAGTTELEGEHFRVVCDFESELLAREALATAEAAYDQAVRLYGVPEVDSLVLHLYGTRAEYEAAEAKITGGVFRRNLAFSSFASREAHVAIQPECTPDQLARIGLPSLTRHQIAHEAAHVVCYNAQRNYQYHPTWMAEGAAMWVGEEAMVAGGWSPGSLADPFTARTRVLAQRLLEEGRLPSLRNTIEDDGVKGLDFFERYAVWGLTFRFLVAERRGEAFLEVLRAGRDWTPNWSYRGKVLHGIRGIWSNDELERLDREFRSWLRGLEPEWNEVHRSLGVGSDSWVQIGFEAEGALAWRNESIRRSKSVLRGHVERMPGSVGELAVILEGDATHSLHAVFRGDGGLALQRVPKAPGPVEILASRDGLAPWDGGRAEFHLRLLGGEIEFWVAGLEPLIADLGDRRVRGAWGLRVDPATVGIWTGVELEE